MSRAAPERPTSPQIRCEPLITQDVGSARELVESIAAVHARVKITVNSDDAIVLGVGVSGEFLRRHHASVFTATELNLIRRWGFTMIESLEITALQRS